MTEVPTPQTPDGAALIAAERQRQINVEGWTPEHDAQHDNNQLAYAATCYTLPSDLRDYATPQPPHFWPWRYEDWKPGDRIRELVKAGALIAAEIDRLQSVTD